MFPLGKKMVGLILHKESFPSLEGTVHKEQFPYPEGTVHKESFPSPERTVHKESLPSPEGMGLLESILPLEGRRGRDNPREFLKLLFPSNQGEMRLTHLFECH